MEAKLVKKSFAFSNNANNEIFEYVDGETKDMVK